jgi:MoxR-like ATPase
VLDGEGILRWQRFVRNVAVAPHVQDYAIRLALATHPGGEFAVTATDKYIRFGASPRGVQALVLAGKVRALLAERYHVSFADLQQAALPALRHRVILNFEGQAEGVANDDVLREILDITPTALTRTADAT